MTSAWPQLLPGLGLSASRSRCLQANTTQRRPTPQESASRWGQYVSWSQVMFRGLLPPKRKIRVGNLAAGLQSQCIPLLQRYRRMRWRRLRRPTVFPRWTGSLTTTSRARRMQWSTRYGGSRIVQCNTHRIHRLTSRPRTAHASSRDVEVLPDGQDIDLAALKRQLETVDLRATCKSAFGDTTRIIIDAIKEERRAQCALETRVKFLIAQLCSARLK